MKVELTVNGKPVSADEFAKLLVRGVSVPAD